MPAADGDAAASSSAVPVGSTSTRLPWCFSFFSCGPLNSIWFNGILSQLLVNDVTGTFY